jgi:ribosomal protein S18 acetylase RimI-like enzyme
MASLLRRLALPVAESLSAAIGEFHCIAEGDEGDPVAENVNGFLVNRRYEPGLRHGISATYLLIDIEKTPPVLGYATLTFDSVRLTNTEKKRMESLVGISEFGAMRIQMIGVDHRHQRTRCGAELLEGITGLARKLSDDVAVRFLLADANARKVGWYEQAGFVRNQAKRETERLNPERSISMRLDLLEGLRGENSAR